jgi:hypothetical protein
MTTPPPYPAAVEEALEWADKRVLVVAEGRPFYDIHAAVMSDEALCTLAAAVRALLHGTEAAAELVRIHMRQRDEAEADLAAARAVLDNSRLGNDALPNDPDRLLIEVDRAPWLAWQEAKR